LLEQLAVYGRLVVPVGSRINQRLVRCTRQPEGFIDEEFASVSFVPLVGKFGWQGDEPDAV
jgi:protein-L-isoaspartate(D-aspartate) O-methyltransferase